MLTGIITNAVALAQTGASPIVYCAAHRLMGDKIQRSPFDWPLFFATLVVALVTLVVAVVQQRQASKAFRVTLITMLLEQRAREQVSGEIKPEELVIWISAVSALLKKWAKRETKQISKMLDTQMREISDKR